MNEMKLPAGELDKYKPMDEARLDRLLQDEIRKNRTKFVVLDDDPTGVQTVHGVSVYTDWSEGYMKEGLLDGNKIFYVLTNSRGMTEEGTTQIHDQIMTSVAEASAETGIAYQFISRSDSTLRGHYPLETELLRDGAEKAGRKIDGEILCPFFKEGGRYTIGNIHYVRYGEELIPAAETEFAKDRTFGYSHSSIPEYVEEKTKGRYKAADVTCISLEDIRSENTDRITEQLMAVKDFNKVCVNAVDYCDLKVFCIALYRAMSLGKNFMFRTAAGFVKTVAGITDIPLLTREKMISGENHNGGIIVVGSHTAKTTAQLEELIRAHAAVPVEFRSGSVLDGDGAFYAEVARCVAEEEKIIAGGRTAVCYTERRLLTVPDDTGESALIRSVRISDGVQHLVSDLNVTPAYVIAKGGITSSDVGTKALRVKRAEVMGQIRPGIPVWKTGKESRFPGIPYVIFPGNVGEVPTLREAAQILSGSAGQH
jgi:uncharacterized protein YgbK (DUF1537 family)